MLNQIRNLKGEIDTLLNCVSELRCKLNTVKAIINNSLYFNDSKDYEIALYESLKLLDDKMDLDNLNYIKRTKNNA